MSIVERVGEKEDASQTSSIRKNAERFALNAYNLRPLEGESSVAYHSRFVSDIASAIVEMGEKAEDRTNLVIIPLSSFQALANRSKRLRNEEAIDQTENQATKNLLSDFQNLPPLFSIEVNFPPQEIPEKIIWQQLIPVWPTINQQISETILWISPPSEERGKKGSHEARFCFYFKGLVNNEPYIIIVAVCGKQNSEECLNLASHLNWNHGYNPVDIPENEQQLREKPLLLFFPKGKIWQNLTEKFENKAVFEAIEKGKCFENKLEAFEIAQEVYQKTQNKLLKAKTAGDYFWAGVEIERSIIYSGKPLFSVSSCGESYLDVLASNPQYTNPFGNQFWSINSLRLRNSLLYSSGGERGKFIRKCGACGKQLNRYMIKGDTCPYCGGVYQGC
ncbi:MAG TPA: hypothetical protein VMW25_01910 [Clostridia bacterium]|nr:hypothetical protein [Clostridia bacterium]